MDPQQAAAAPVGLPALMPASSLNTPLPYPFIHPLVADAIEIFDGKLIDIKVL